MEGGGYGTIRATWTHGVPESGRVATMETRAVVERDRAGARHACRVDPRRRGLPGGIVPGTRRRSRLALTLAEREEISRGLAAATSIRHIAARLGRAPSTVSREIARHGGRPGYRAAGAGAAPWRTPTAIASPWAEGAMR